MFFLTKKMIRSIKQFKFQFICAMLLAVLSVGVYSGLEGIWSGMKYEFDKFVDENNLADEWVMATYFTDDDVSAIQNLKGVTDTSKHMRLSVNMQNKDGETNYLSLDTVENENISSIHIIDGEKYNKEQANSVWIDSEYADSNDISVGNVISLEYNSEVVDATVAGIVMSPERVHFVGTADYYIPDHYHYGYGYMSEDLLDNFNVMIKCNLLEIKSNDSEVNDQVNNIIGERFLAYYDRDSLFDVSYVSTQVNNLRRISLLFSSLFTLLSVLSVHTTIKRLIDAQASDIATLKSLGFSNKSLILHYSIYGLVVSVLGTGIGYIFSFTFSKIVQKTQQELISLPEWPIKHTIGSLVLILMIIILSVLTSVSAAKKTMIGLPAEFTQKRVKHNNKVFLEKIGSFWNKISFGMKWTLRDAAAHKTRIFLGIISVCGSFMLLIVGFGMPDSVTSLTKKTYSDEFLYTNKLTLNNASTPEELDALGKQFNGQFIENVQSKIRFNQDKEVYYKSTTIFSDGEYINLKTVDNQDIDDNGIYITEGLAEALNVKEGDNAELSPSFSDQSYNFKVMGIIPSSMPQSIYIKDKCWEKAGAVFRPSHMLTGKINNIDDLKTDDRITQVITSEQQENNLTDFNEAAVGVFKLMRLVAFILVFIVLYNLSILSFLERTKEYNTFRVLGFHFNEIRVLASFENIIILLLGSIIGVPFGFEFLKLYCSTFSNDNFKIYSNISNVNFIIVCCIVFLCTIVTTFFLSLRVKKIDMVQALKE